MATRSSCTCCRTGSHWRRRSCTGHWQGCRHTSGPRALADGPCTAAETAAAGFSEGLGGGGIGEAAAGRRRARRRRGRQARRRADEVGVSDPHARALADRSSRAGQDRLGHAGPSKELVDAAVARGIGWVGNGPKVVTERKVSGRDLVGPLDGRNVGQVVAEERLPAALGGRAPWDAGEHGGLARHKPVRRHRRHLDLRYPVRVELLVVVHTARVARLQRRRRLGWPTAAAAAAAARVAAAAAAVARAAAATASSAWSGRAQTPRAARRCSCAPRTTPC